jgi:hypothetical protein
MCPAQKSGPKLGIRGQVICALTCRQASMESCSTARSSTHPPNRFFICSEMTCQPPPETQPADAQDGGDRTCARPLFERQIAMSGQLAEAGLEVALILKDQVKAAHADGSAEVVVSAGATFARVARAVRMTILLQSKLIRQLQDWDRNTAFITSCDLAEKDSEREALTDQRKARIEQIVERGAWDVERLVVETAERLDQDDIYGDLLDRPISELVAMICKDLGLDPDWPQLAQEAWAREEVGSGVAGWPLAPATDSSPSDPLQARSAHGGSSP